MTETRTVSVPALPVDPEAVGWFRFGRFEDGWMLTNEFGEWHHCDDATFRALVAGTLDDDAEARPALAAKGFLRADLDLDHTAAAMRLRKRYVGLGPTRHVIHLASGDDRLTVDVAKNVVDHAMLSTAGALELHAVAPAGEAPDLDLLGFLVQYAIEKNRYEGKTVTWRLSSDLSEASDDLVAFLVDKRFQITTPWPASDAARDAVARIDAAATAKKRATGTVTAAVALGADTDARAVATALAEAGIARCRAEPAPGTDESTWSSAYAAFLDACLAQGGLVEARAAEIAHAASATDGTDAPSLRSPTGAGAGELVYDARGRIFPSAAAMAAHAAGDDLFLLGEAGDTSYRDVVTHGTQRAMAVASLLECLPGFADHWACPYLGVDPTTVYAEEGDLFGRLPTTPSVRTTLAAVEVVFAHLVRGEAGHGETLRGWSA